MKTTQTVELKQMKFDAVNDHGYYKFYSMTTRPILTKFFIKGS
jgi:hypothetical protein